MRLDRTGHLAVLTIHVRSYSLQLLPFTYCIMLHEALAKINRSTRLDDPQPGQENNQDQRGCDNLNHAGKGSHDQLVVQLTAVGKSLLNLS